MNNDILYKNSSGFLGVVKRRTLRAAKYSWQGLRACYEHEEAFRVEIYVAIPLLPLAWMLAGNDLELICLISTLLLVLIVELLNSAIENIVDRAGKEHHELAGRSKDQGSAAVLLSVVVFLGTWLFIGFN